MALTVTRNPFGERCKGRVLVLVEVVRLPLSQGQRPEPEGLELKARSGRFGIGECEISSPTRRGVARSTRSTYLLVYGSRRERERFENQQEITSVTGFWALPPEREIYF